MYSICALQYGLTRTQKADYFIHLFSGAATKPQEKISLNIDETMTLSEMASIALKEYMSDARQMQVKVALEKRSLKN